jgi:cytochrome c556
MKRIILALAFTATAAFAQGNLIEQRKGLLKEMGGASRPVGAMLKGEAPFNAAQVKAFADVVSKNSKLLPALFPAGSYTGDTTASPKIGEEKAKFDALFADMDKAAVTLASVTDEAVFKVQAGALLKSCGTCHETYRIKK